MKRLLTACLSAVAILVLSACAASGPRPLGSTDSLPLRTSSGNLLGSSTVGTAQSGASSSNQSKPSSAAEVRAMWISYSELGDAFGSGNFKKAFDKMVDDCKSMGINTLYVHARAFCDSFYPSDIFPWSKYALDSLGKPLSFDPFAYMVESAHARDMELHAWINPYRVSLSTDKLSELPDGSPVKGWLADSDKDNDNWAVGWDGGVYLDPSVTGVGRLILDGVREIVERYKVDGIHFDDYFYPTTDEDFDSHSYSAYLNSVSGKPLGLADWRRSCVNGMVASVSSYVRGKGLSFGISPAANIELNYNEIYADIYTWVEKGYLDYIIPQIYYGFEYPNEKYTYTALLNEWIKLVDRRTPMYIGLGAYRIGDSTATGGAEWCKQNSRILARQISALRDKGLDGFAIFSYSTMMANTAIAKGERQAAVEVIKNGDKK